MSQDPQPPAGPQGGTYQHQQLSARVPEHVALGVFSTGAIVLTTQTEFVIDFLIRMARPHQVAARVVMPPAVIPQVIQALEQAIDRWTEHFGQITAMPKPDQPRNISLQDVYEDLKLGDHLLSGAYANGVMISFSAAEFSFDFITNFFPRSAVSQRVYLSAPQIPRLLEALQQTFTDFQKRILSQQQPPAQDDTPPNDTPDTPDTPPEEAPQS